MPPVVSLFVLAFAVSLDGFGVGVMYGLRKIRMPLYAVGIISLCSGTIIYCSMKLGEFMLRFLSPAAAKTIGALILMGIGIWAIYQMIAQKDQDGEGTSPPEADGCAAPASLAAIAGKSAAPPVHATPVEDGRHQQKKIMHIEIKRLGLVIQILKTPSKADLDHSGNISAAEAILLGVALSLDSFGAGIGAALIGFAPLLTATVIALSSGSFVAAGLRIGFLYCDLRWLRKLSILPGCVLILMGILKLL